MIILSYYYEMISLNYVCKNFIMLVIRVGGLLTVDRCLYFFKFLSSFKTFTEFAFYNISIHFISNII